MKRILIAISGLSPQILTETLYALHLRGKMPSTIRILTTREGKLAIIAQLLQPEEGQYHRFLKDYAIPPETIDFTAEHIHAVADAFGNEYDDIAGEEENECFLTLCMEQTFVATRQDDCEVLFSLAGGRKTMGACLAVAAQCYARPQDRIFHVLITPEFESSSQFYYPPPVSVPLELQDNRTHTPYILETRYAEVFLLPLPFFSFRDRLTDNHLSRVESPAELMLSLVKEKRAELLIDLTLNKIIWKGRELDIMPTPLAIYLFFALIKKNAPCSISCQGCGTCTITREELLSNVQTITELYRQKIPPDHISEGIFTSDMQTLTAESFNSHRNRINRELEKAFGHTEAKRLQIVTHGKRPGISYGIPLGKDRLRIVM